jgi:hypothetical protein
MDHEPAMDLGEVRHPVEVQTLEMGKAGAGRRGPRIPAHLLPADLREAAAESAIQHVVWRGSYLRFIAKYTCPGPNALAPFFEISFARLDCFDCDHYNLWARRHNDQWIVLAEDVTLAGAFPEMRTNPCFHF